MHYLDDVTYSLRRFFVDEFHYQNIPAIIPGSRVLDIGGTRSDKRGRFTIASYDLRVTSVNITTARRPDVAADAADLPFRDRSFDAVVCSEVLEHVPDPGRVLAEAHRVLRAEGTLLACVPFLHRIHGDPDDYGRYTDQFWKMLLMRLGFMETRVQSQGAFWSVLTDMLTLAASGRIRPAEEFLPVLGNLDVRLGALRRSALVADVQSQGPDNRLAGSYTTGFGIVAKKGVLPS